ncbi:hypothetical protein T10_4269 [Trichinella papuae]|uniref:Uncharacterized protein n=1 Tax=Trichinella papuae TaxID=268474 RepID=A0A0V1M0S2_9BILA|nr:hypothetical protein T10_4269 [Trichinella papuae]
MDLVARCLIADFSRYCRKPGTKMTIMVTIGKEMKYITLKLEPVLGENSKEPENYNKTGRTFHESVFVDILSKTLNHDAILVGTSESEMECVGLMTRNIINYNESGRTLPDCVFVEILPKTLKLDTNLVGTTESEIKLER